MIKYYRETFGIFACSGFLFNHESPLRSDRFVTSKIVTTACQIALGMADSLVLGRLDISRDWGYAPEYTQAMHLMLAASTPRDYLICTGTSSTLLHFVNLVFDSLNLQAHHYLAQSDAHCRPNDIVHSKGNPAEATECLKWSAKTHLPELVHILVREKLSSLISLRA